MTKSAEKPIVKQSDRVFRELEEMVTTGEFGEDGRLDEAKLAEHFGVSRTPVREALQKLSQSGVVEQIPRRGVFVRKLDPGELFQLFEFMAELEAACARLAAKRISDAAISELESINKRCMAAVRKADTEAYYSENEQFHRIIYEQSGNAALATEALKLQRRLRPFRRLQLRIRGRLAQSMQEHEDIVSMLTAGNSDGVADALRAHVSVQGEKFALLTTSLEKQRKEKAEKNRA